MVCRQVIDCLDQACDRTVPPAVFKLGVSVEGNYSTEKKKPRVIEGGGQREREKKRGEERKRERNGGEEEEEDRRGGEGRKGSPQAPITPGSSQNLIPLGEASLARQD